MPAVKSAGRAARLSRCAAVATTTALVFAGAVALAPTASAVGSSACGHSYQLIYYNKITKDAVHFRTGPGTSYASRGLLRKGDKIALYCYSTNGSNWDYVKIHAKSKTGIAKGTKGWVSSKYSKTYASSQR
ncbi:MULTISPECIES: SH3 domain-containing protein [unclassified Streptomyces]|uniref:SH3 domain-containing protein n=1 Tax=unclassified Streptomyces TaxID=2593676 RepID=UPI00340A5B66